MRELTSEEIEQVSGGVGVLGAVIGAVVGGGSAAFNGGNVGNIIGGAALGAVSGFFGGIATASTGLARGLFSVYSIESGLMSSAAGS